MKIEKVKFSETKMENVKNLYYPMACPEEGSFIGYKKCISRAYKKKVIVELGVLKEAKRSSATTRKCRCSKAKVLSITNIDGSLYNGNTVMSAFDQSFIYRVGDVVEVDDFDENRWHECSTGIHFFMDRKEAVKY